MGLPTKAWVTLWLLSSLLDWTMQVAAATRQEASQLEESQWYNTLMSQRRRILAASSGQDYLEYGNTFDPDSLASQVFTGELDLEQFRSTRKLLQSTVTSDLTEISPPAGSASPLLTVPTTVALASPPPASPSSGSILANVESGLLTAGTPPAAPATVATPPSGGATLFYNPGRKLLVPQ